MINERERERERESVCVSKKSVLSNSRTFEQNYQPYNKNITNQPNKEAINQITNEPNKLNQTNNQPYSQPTSQPIKNITNN